MGNGIFPGATPRGFMKIIKLRLSQASIALVAKNMGLEAGKPELSPCHLGFLPKLPKLRLLMCKMERLTVPFQGHGPESTR